jgi:chemotaxis protein MotB
MTVHDVDEQETGGYFASVSDLMVGILFVFLLVLTVFALNYRVEEHQEEVSRQQYLKKKEQFDRLRKFLEEKAQELQQAIDASSNARNRLLGELQTSLAQRGIKVWVDRDAGILHLPGDLLFATNTASLGPQQRDNVDIVADALGRTLPCFTPISDRPNCDPADLPILETVLIEGHTDRRPIAPGGAFRDNDQLSTERALAVFAEFKRVQPDLDILKNADRSYPLLGVAGFGDRRPLPQATGDNEQDYQQNRRIDLRFILARNAELERLHGEIEHALHESEK